MLVSWWVGTRRKCTKEQPERKLARRKKEKKKTNFFLCIIAINLYPNLYSYPKGDQNSFLFSCSLSFACSHFGRSLSICCISKLFTVNFQSNVGEPKTNDEKKRAENLLPRCAWRCGHVHLGFCITSGALNCVGKDKITDFRLKCARRLVPEPNGKTNGKVNGKCRNFYLFEFIGKLQQTHLFTDDVPSHITFRASKIVENWNSIYLWG